MQEIIKVKCPHCGWVRKIELDLEIGKAEPAKDLLAGASLAVAGFASRLSKHWQEKIEPLLKERPPDPENDWLPLPPCSSCEKPYEYNVKTGERR